MPKQPKPKAPKLTKEQIAMQMAAKAEADKFKKIIREKVWPVLQKASSIFKAQQIAEIFKSVMNAKMNDYWADKTMADLDLKKQMDEEGEFPDKAIYEYLAESLAELSISDAQKLLQGMGGALDGYTRKLAEKQPISEIPVEEIINK